MKRQIWEINENLVNKNNFAQKIEDAFKFIDELSDDCDKHIGFLTYEFIVNPSLMNVDELGKILQLKHILLKQAYEEVCKAYHSGSVEICEECYEHLKANQKTDAEYWGDSCKDDEERKKEAFNFYINEFIEETKDMINKLDEEKNKGGKNG